MDDTLEKRVDALERALTDGDEDLTALATDAEMTERLDELETQIDELDEQLAELDAATQALRGYVGNIRSVNRNVEQRADSALEKAQAVENALETINADTQTATDTPPNRESTTPSAQESVEETKTRQTGESGRASADGGVRLAAEDSPQETRCHACGQTHDEPKSEESLAPEKAEQTGTLQRMREML